MSIRAPAKPFHPALIAHAEERASGLQNRIADAITTFAGSMPFVYVHVIWFISWIAIGVEDFPFGFLTMIVSLEAIFLSTFVMISQNRADQKRQALADHQWELIQLEKKQNEDLIGMSQHLLELTTEVHALTTKVHDLVQAHS